MVKDNFDFGIIEEERLDERRNGIDRRRGYSWKKEDYDQFGERRAGFERRSFERRIDSEQDDPL